MTTRKHNYKHKKKQVLYTILISGLIPATWMFGLTILGVYFAIPNAEISFDYILTICSMLMGVGGYVGLLLLFKGLHQTNHITKLILLMAGLSGFLIFMIHESPRKFTDWLIACNVENMVGKWPLIVSLLFSILIINDLRKKKILTNKA